jgi:hypothetical protein
MWWGEAKNLMRLCKSLPVRPYVSIFSERQPGYIQLSSDFQWDLFKGASAPSVVENLWSKAKAKQGTTTYLGF